MSEQVERRLLTLLGNPTESPYGTPIPGLDELGLDAGDRFLEGVVPVTGFTGAGIVRRLGEPLQFDVELLRMLQDAGIVPGAAITVESTVQHVRVIGAEGGAVDLAHDLAAHLYVIADS